MAVLSFCATVLVEVLVATSDVAEDPKADDEYAILFLNDDAATADDDFNTEKQSPMASCWLRSNRMRLLDRFIVGR